MNLTNVFSSTDALLAMLGQHNGIVTISDSTQVNGKFFSIQIITDTVFTILTESNHSGGTITGVTLKAGMTLYGEFLAVKLTSGIVRAYKA